MNTYRITNSQSGHVLGDYPGGDEGEALDAMARDAGYRDHADACAVTGGDGSDLCVVEVPAVDATQPYRLIDTETRRVVAVGDSEAEVLTATPYLPADCVPDAETWEEVLEVARHHADGIPGVVEGYAVERATSAPEPRKNRAPSPLPWPFLLLLLSLALPALAAPAHRIKPLETVTVKTMPAGTLKAGEHVRLTALDADSCTAWVEEPQRAEAAFLSCRRAIARCQAGDCRKAGQGVPR